MLEQQLRFPSHCLNGFLRSDLPFLCAFLLISSSTLFVVSTDISIFLSLAPAPHPTRQVRPFSALIDLVGERVPRLLINREPVGVRQAASPYLVHMAALGLIEPVDFSNDGFAFGFDDNQRDVFLGGECDGGARTVCERIGAETELDAAIAASQWLRASSSAAAAVPAASSASASSSSL
jgi:hypothetical protein